MEKHTVKKNKNFTVINNQFLRNKSMSLAARGLLTTILMLPDNWNFSINGIVSLLPEGQSAVRTVIRELRHLGHCVYRKENGKSGIISHVYEWHEVAIKVDTSTLPAIKRKKRPKKEKPYVAQPYAEKPHMVNPHMEKPNVVAPHVENPQHIKYVNDEELKEKNTKENKEEKNKENSFFFLLLSKVSFSPEETETVTAFKNLPDNEKVSGWLEKYGEASVLKEIEAINRLYSADKRQAANVRDFTAKLDKRLADGFISPEIESFATAFCAAFQQRNGVPYRFNLNRDSSDVAGAGEITEYLKGVPGLTLEKMLRKLPEFWKAKRVSSLARNIESVCAAILNPKMQAVDDSKRPAYITQATLESIRDYGKKK